ncbi:hypothetical protein [Paraburkholderia tropica]|uniref:hypothetical protein n=1 Tax=Paraburkholderia tropica TaxID=92647 RepID=UPI002AB7696D|nr:hypothetical protein [Paraburkholderia tropica]
MSAETAQMSILTAARKPGLSNTRCDLNSIAFFMIECAGLVFKEIRRVSVLSAQYAFPAISVIALAARNIMKASWRRARLDNASVAHNVARKFY